MQKNVYCNLYNAQCFRFLFYKKRGRRISDPQKSWNSSTFLDDGTGVFRGNENEYMEFFELCNSEEADVSFTEEHQVGGSKLVSLVLRLWIASSGKVDFELFRKEECGNKALPVDSARSRALQSSYIQSEVMRTRLRCSSQEYATKNLKEFKQRLESAGNHRWLITKNF